MRYSKLLTKKLYIVVASVLVISTLYLIQSSSSVIPSPLNPTASIVDITSNKDLSANHGDSTLPHIGSQNEFANGESKEGNSFNTGSQLTSEEEKSSTEKIQEAQLQHQEEVEHKLNGDGEKGAESQNGEAEEKGNDKIEQGFNINHVEGEEKGNDVTGQDFKTNQIEAEQKENDQEKAKVPKHVRYIPESILANLQQSTDAAQIDWSKFAYIQYATREDYICNALINFAKLRSDFKTKATLMLILTNEAYLHFGETMKNELTKLDVIIKVVKKLQFKSADVTWVDGFTKFYVFGLEEYNKVIYLDSDATILGNMDELFFIPDEVDIAMPLAYDETAHRMKQKLATYDSAEESEKEIPKCSRKTEEERSEFEYKILNDALLDESKYKDEGGKVTDKKDMNSEMTYHSLVYQRLPYVTNEVLFDTYYFSDHFMVIKPNEETFKELLVLCETKGEGEYDMNLINKKFSVKNVLSSLDTELLILPHKTYGALSGTFKVQEYELLYYTDPTEIECYARKEIEREQKEQAMKEEKESGEDNQNDVENGKEDETNLNQEDKSPEIDIDHTGPIVEHVALLQDDLGDEKKIEGQDSSEGTEFQEIPNPMAGNKGPEDNTNNDGERAKMIRRNEDTNVSDEIPGASGEINRADEPSIELNEEERKSNEEETNKVWQALKLVHFSDYPIPKPWLERHLDVYYIKDLILCPSEVEKMQVYKDKPYHPRIVNDCAASNYWNGLYETFALDRRNICGLEHSHVITK
ncbi:hypothetical protein CLIB1423_26S01244 [[Candida] railenensis]|uniref:Glycogenin glucosyltransferase n=1 Tax=[Candida] railenensis TaxID=45579 RepID=A0A9P0QVR6_9ASCO|nr:hypothetical protein CLIB1423_26S01244 [[Candida] railenensis]